MGTFAAIIGTIGGLCAVLGILLAAGTVTAAQTPIKVGWDFWFMLAGILLLGCIALLLGRSPGKD